MQPDHLLKTDPEQYNAVVYGQKRHEVRVFDREYKVGQVVHLSEFDRTTQTFTGRSTFVRINDITAPGTYGLPHNIGVFSIFLLDDEPHAGS